MTHEGSALDFVSLTGEDLREGMQVYDRMRVCWVTVTELWISDSYVLGVKPMVFTGVWGEWQKKVYSTTAESPWAVRKDSIPK